MVQCAKPLLRSSIHTETCHVTQRSHFLWHKQLGQTLLYQPLLKAVQWTCFLGQLPGAGGQRARPQCVSGADGKSEEAGKRATGLTLLISTWGAKCQCAFCLFVCFLENPPIFGATHRHTQATHRHT